MLKPVFYLVVVLAVLAVACSPSRRPVEVRWESKSSVAVLADAGSHEQADPLDTVVYVSVNGEDKLRKVVVRLIEDNAEELLGMNIGSVTPVSTEFEGTSRVWRLGDLEPGKRYGLPIGLWFSSTQKQAAPEHLRLSVEITSPDLPEPVRSNVLAVNLKQ
jgi:hypothetical protein